MAWYQTSVLGHVVDDTVQTVEEQTGNTLLLLYIVKMNTYTQFIT